LRAIVNSWEWSREGPARTGTEVAKQLISGLKTVLCPDKGASLQSESIFLCKLVFVNNPGSQPSITALLVLSGLYWSALFVDEDEEGMSFVCVGVQARPILLYHEEEGGDVLVLLGAAGHVVARHVGHEPVPILSSL